jgi:hypothetical protein
VPPSGSLKCSATGARNRDIGYEIAARILAGWPDRAAEQELLPFSVEEPAHTDEHHGRYRRLPSHAASANATDEYRTSLP